MLIPYSTEIWSNIGILPKAGLNLTNGFFPSILNHFDSPQFISLFIGLLTICSVLFTLGIQRAIVSILLWYGWVCLFDRNNLISNPGIPFIGWILLCCAAIPQGEAYCLFKPKKTIWEFPKTLFIGAWIIMSVSYTISGIDKFLSPSWYDGSAIIHLLNNPLARDWGLRNYLLSLPKDILNFMTWSILALEVSFLPLSLWDKSRKWVWLLMVLMHLGILLIVDFADLTIGMLMIHLFTLDTRWLIKNVE